MASESRRKRETIDSGAGLAAREVMFAASRSANSGEARGPGRVRVLIVAPSLRILGGQAVQASRLLAALDREQSVDVSFLPINPRLPGPLAWLQSIKYVRTLVTSVLYWSLLFLRVRTHDVIHVFSAAYWSFVLSPTPAILVAKLYRRKILLNYRSGEAADHLMRWRRSVPSIMRLADKIVVPSEYLVKVFEQFGIRAEVVPNMVDLEHFAFRERLALRPVLLSARNLEPLYDIECLLRSFALVQAQIGDARLILAGDGSERARLEALRIELGLANVDFIGQVTPDEMPAIYDQADIFVNSSSIDNMPVSLIEASARGLPIVTTDAGGIGYMLKHGRTGLIVATGDHEGLARNVLALLRDARMALELARAARAECEKYTWGAVRCDWLALYRTLAERPSCRSVSY